jgi:hypothetical protein
MKVVRPFMLVLSLLVALTLAVPAHAHAPGVALSGVGSAGQRADEAARAEDHRHLQEKRDCELGSGHGPR